MLDGPMDPRLAQCRSHRGMLSEEGMTERQKSEDEGNGGKGGNAPGWEKWW